MKKIHKEIFFKFNFMSAHQVTTKLVHKQICFHNKGLILLTPFCSRPKDTSRKIKERYLFMSKTENKLEVNQDISKSSVNYYQKKCLKDN